MKLLKKPESCPVCSGPWLAEFFVGLYPSRLECLICGAVIWNMTYKGREEWMVMTKEQVDKIAKDEFIRQAEEKGLTDEGYDKMIQDLGLPPYKDEE